MGAPGSLTSVFRKWKFEKFYLKFGRKPYNESVSSPNVRMDSNNKLSNGGLTSLDENP